MASIPESRERQLGRYAQSLIVSWSATWAAQRNVDLSCVFDMAYSVEQPYVGAPLLPEHSASGQGKATLRHHLSGPTLYVLVSSSCM